jgi:hypothetical protein
MSSFLRVLRVTWGPLLTLSALCNAAMYRVPQVEGNSSLLVFRDAAQPNAFYFIPSVFITASTSGPHLGIQYYSDGKSKSDVSAAVTLSVVAQVTQAQLNEVMGNIRQRFKLNNPQLTPPPRVRTRLVAYRVNDVVSTLGDTQWSYAALDASQSISFSLSHISRSTLKRLLSADGASLAVVVELQLDGVVDGVASGQIHSNQIRNLMQKRSQITAGSDFEEFLSDFLDHVVEVAPEDKPYLRDSARAWLVQRLGSPSLLKPNHALAYGWQLGDSSLAKTADESIQVVRGTPRNEPAAGIVSLGNLCELNPTAIVNLDDGASGCASLR